MDTEQLKTFLEVNRTRHFGRAAKNLFLSQSAVSARIQGLEDQLGTPLFIRSRNDIQPTPAGQRLQRHAENILAAWNRARDEISIEENTTASLTIAGMPSLWDIILQNWLSALHNKLPDIAIHAEIHHANSISRRLMEGSLDLGFTFEVSQTAQLEIRQIASIPLIMVSSKSGLGSAEATQQDYILVDWGLSFAIAHARHFPDNRTPRIRLPLGRIALEYLFACGGSAYIAESMVRTALATGRLYRVDNAPVIERPAYALFSHNSPRSALINQALELLV